MRFGVAPSSSSISRGPLSLPLLEGLACRPSGADSIVHQALDQWQAEQRISDWLSRRIQKRKDKDASSNTKKRNRSRHWLIQGLCSSSLPERQVACKLLCQGCSLSDLHRQWQLMELLVELCQEPELSEHCFVAWIALLQHLIVVHNNNRTALAFLRHPRMGLNWICKTLLDCATSKKIVKTQSLVKLLHVLTFSNEGTSSIAVEELWQNTKRWNSITTCMLGGNLSCLERTARRSSSIDGPDLQFSASVDRSCSGYP